MRMVRIRRFRRSFKLAVTIVLLNTFGFMNFLKMFNFIMVDNYIYSYTIRSMDYHSSTTTFIKVRDVDMYWRFPVFESRLADKKFIRILAIAPWSSQTVYCHMTFKGSETIAFVTRARVEPQESSTPTHCKWYTGLVNCGTLDGNIPIHVSISKAHDGPSDGLWQRVTIPKYSPPDQSRYGICISTLFDIPDEENNIVHLIEWFEMQKLLGVNNVILYGTDNVAPVIMKVLKSYIDSGFLIYHSWDLPMPSIGKAVYSKSNKPEGSRKNCIFYHAQHLAYNDCLYRYMDDFTYLALFDKDEYIIPSEHYTWQEMLKDIESQPESINAAAYYFLDACFDSTIAAHRSVMHKNMTLRMQTRSYYRLNEFRFMYHVAVGKSMVKPTSILNTHVHLPEVVVPGYNRHFEVNPKIGRLNHYKAPGNRCNVTDAAIDLVTMKYDERLVQSIKSKLDNLDLANTD